MFDCVVVFALVLLVFARFFCFRFCFVVFVCSVFCCLCGV